MDVHSSLFGCVNEGALASLYRGSRALDAIHHFTALAPSVATWDREEGVSGGAHAGIDP